MRNAYEKRPQAAAGRRRTLARLGLVAVATASLLLAGAAAQESGAPAPRSGAAGAASDAATALFGASTWFVERLVLDGEERPLSASVTSAFSLIDDPQALAGTAGCNQMTASFELDAAGEIEFGPIVATLMACPEPAMTQERDITRALEGVTHYRRQAERVVLSGQGVELVLVSAALGATAPGEDDRPGRAAFNRAVERAAAAGAAWPSDPLRVALAFVSLAGAPQTTVTRSDASAEGAELTVVTVLEEGPLDDSLAGARQRVTLERDGEIWLVTGHETVWLCARGPDRELTEPQRCP